MKTSNRIFVLIALFSVLAFKTQKQKTTLSETPPKDNTIKVALLLDTSNSMDGLIDQAKTQLWDIVNELSYARCNGTPPSLQIALYEYGNDALEKSDGYIRQVLGFSSDLDLISEKLFSLKTDGGSEYCGQVIQTSIQDLKWGKNKQDLNLIFIAGNEAFTQGSVSYIDATADAKEKHITVNTIFCGTYQNGVSGQWKDGALRTGGDYFAIDHNRKQIYIRTPYDDIIIRLNSQLNDTYIHYGREGREKSIMQSTQDTNALEMEEVVIVKRAVSKSSRIYNNASWDLVDASKDKGFSYAKINKKNLDKKLQGKSTQELKIYVEEQARKRKEIQKQINDLNAKRKVFIAKKQQGNKDKSLENALILSIKKQAKKNNYTW